MRGLCSSPPRDRSTVTRNCLICRACRVARSRPHSGSYLSQNDLRAHFGLAAAASADRIEVVWPSGRTETLTNVSANQIISIKEGNGIVAHKPLSR
jgi:hypothetical protein